MEHFNEESNKVKVATVGSYMKRSVVGHSAAPG